MWHISLCIVISCQCGCLIGVNGLSGSEFYLVKIKQGCFLGRSSLLLKSRTNTAWRWPRQMVWPSPFLKGLGGHSPSCSVHYLTMSKQDWLELTADSVTRYYTGELHETITCLFSGSFGESETQIWCFMRMTESSNEGKMFMKGGAKAWSLLVALDVRVLIPCLTYSYIPSSPHFDFNRIASNKWCFNFILWFTLNNSV